MSRIVSNTSLLDRPSEIRTLILENVFEGSEHELRIVKEEDSNSLWLKPNDFDTFKPNPFDEFQCQEKDNEPPPEILFDLQKLYQEGSPIYARSLVLKFTTAWITAETPDGFSQISHSMQNYYLPYLRKIQTSRLGLTGIPWKCMLALEHVDMNLDDGHDGGTMYLVPSCSVERAETYYMGRRDHRLMRTVVWEAKQGRIGEPLQAMLNIECRKFSLTLTLEVGDDFRSKDLELTFDVDALAVLYRILTHYPKLATITWTGRWIVAGQMDHLGNNHTSDVPKTRWVKEVAVAEDEEDCSGDFSWPDSWKFPHELP